MARTNSIQLHAIGEPERSIQDRQPFLSPGSVQNSATKARSRTKTSSTSSDESLPPLNAHHLGGSWWMEIAGLVLSLASFIAMLYLLFAFDGQQVTKWVHFPVSLNTVVSILAAVSKTCLAFVISGCLSQGKWNWISHSSAPLIDFDRFDAASRGPWGGFRLLRSFVKRPHWAALGALTVVILIAYEPFLQAIITYEDRPVTLDTAQYLESSGPGNATASGSYPRISKSTKLDSGSWTTLAGNNAVSGVIFKGPHGENVTYSGIWSSSQVRGDMGISAAVYNGFSRLTSAQNLWPAYTCTTSNCTWDYYVSLALCSKCNNLADHVKKSSGVSKVPEIELPGGFVNGSAPDISNQDPNSQTSVVGQKMPWTKYKISEIDLELSNYNGKTRCESSTELCPDTYLSARLTTNPGHTMTFRDAETMLLAIQAFEADSSWENNKTTWEKTKVTALECGLQLCVNEYKSTLKQGVLYEETLASWTDKVANSYQGSSGANEYYKYFLNHSLDFGERWGDMSDLQIAMPKKGGQAKSSKEQKYNVTQLSIMSLLNVFNAGLTNGGSLSSAPLSYIYPGGSGALPNLMIGLGDVGNVSSAFDNAALSVTKWMRDREPSSTAAHGNATQIVTITRVEWKFLSFPAFTLLLGFAFALLSIWETHRLRRPAWKESTIALLAHSPGRELSERLQGEAAVGRLGEVGRTTRVGLRSASPVSSLVMESR